MAVPTKAEQVAESLAREKAGIDPAMTAAATEGTEGDGVRGEVPGERQQRQGDPEPQRAAPPVQSKFDVKRDDILKRFRTDRGVSETEARDEISDFQRSGMPPEFEPPAELRADPQPGEGDQVEQQLEPEGEGDGGIQPEAKPQTVRVKVHGVEKDITLDELVAHAQKAMAADNILDSAKATAKELETLVSQARDKVARADRPDPNQVRQPSTQTETGEHADQGADAANQGDPLVKLIENMQFGDPNEGAPVLRKTIAELVNAGVKQAREQERLTDEGARAARALAKANEDHPEIANDPAASAAVSSFILRQQVEDIKALGVDPKQLRPDGLDPTADDIAVAHRWYRAKGFAVSSPETMLENGIAKFLDWRGTSNPKPADPAPAPDTKAAPRIEISVDRRERRAAVPQQPKPSGATPRPAAPVAPQTRDRSAIVADMMGSRNKPRGRVGITN